MKFSTAAVAAVAAASVLAQAIPAPVVVEEGLEKRAELNDVLGAIDNLVAVLNTKREAGEIDVVAYAAELAQRDFDWSALLQLLLKALPGLIKSVWDSGIIQLVFKAIWNNQTIKDALFNGLKYVLNAILGLFTKSADTTPAAATGKAQTKRMLDELERLQMSNDLSARDFVDTIGTIIKAIWSSGIIQLVFNWVINWVKTNPEQVQNLLKLALSVVSKLVSSIWTWAQQNGYVEKVFQWIGANIGKILTSVINFILSLFGGNKAGTTTQSAAPAPAPAATGAPKQKREFNRMY